MDHACLPVHPQDQRITREGTEHQGHAIARAYMTRRFIAAARQVQPHDPIVIKDAQGVCALWRQIDPPGFCSSRHEEDRLAFDERPQGAV